MKNSTYDLPVISVTNSFIGIYTFCFLFFVFVTGCSDNEVLYFPYDPKDAEKTWMSLEDAMKQEKYDFIIEVSKFVGKKQTVKQKKMADRLFQNTFENATKKGWGDIEKVVADGYVYEPDRDLTHLTNYEYMFDDEVLNPEKPEFLMFYYTEQGPILAGVAFVLAELYTHGPQIGGHETVWHFHSYPSDCVANPYPEGHKLRSTLIQGECKAGEVFVDRSPEMLHVWFVNHPYGRFASMMSIDAELLYNNPFAKFANSSQSVMKKEHELKGALIHHH